MSEIFLNRILEEYNDRRSRFIVKNYELNGKMVVIFCKDKEEDVYCDIHKENSDFFLYIDLKSSSDRWERHSYPLFSSNSNPNMASLNKDKELELFFKDSNFDWTPYLFSSYPCLRQTAQKALSQ